MNDYLFAHPSFLHGIARTLDLGGTFASYNESASAGEADRIAPAADWLAVGQDIREACATELERQERLNEQAK